MKTTAALSAFIVVTLALVATAVVGAQRLSKLFGVTALHSTAERVYVAVGGSVVIASHDGAVLGVAADENGRPWSFEDVTGITVDAEGKLLVADGERGEVVRFDASGHAGVRIPILREGEPPEHFEIAALPGGKLVLAETPGHRLSIVAPTGEVLKSQRVRYPNGPSVGPGVNGEPAVYVLETGALRLHAFDAQLNRVETPLLEGLRELVASLKKGASGAPRLGHEMLDFTLEEGGTALVHYCRNTEGDCTVVRLDPEAQRAVAIGDASIIDAELTQWARSLMMTEESVPGPNGRVYVASPVFGAVFAFDPPENGAPLCVDCSRAGLGLERVPFESLWEGGWTLENGARVSVFGDQALRERYRAQAKARVLYERVEQVGRYGVIASAVLLLGLLFVLRQSGAVDSARLQDRLAELFARIVAPDAGVLAACAVLVAVAAGLGSLVGALVFGTSGAIALGVGVAVLASRLGAVPLLVVWRRAQFAEEAWRLHHAAERLPRLALAAEEKMEWVALSRVAERTTKHLRAARAAADASDPLEVLEAIAPRLTLLARTNRRLLVSHVSVLGAPVDAILSAEVVPYADADSARGIRLLTARGEVSFTGPQVAGRREELVATELRYLCERCGAEVGRCAHSGGRRAWLAVLITGVVPGLGHLLQYRFRRGRTVMAVGLTFLFAGLYELLPQWLGTVPYAPSRFAVPLLAYAVVWAGALVDVVVWTVRQRRRASVNASAGEESAPAHADLEVG